MSGPPDDLVARTVSLQLLHGEIDRCRECETVVAALKKPPKMDRGSLGRIFVVGEGPGQREHASGKAFSGTGGKRLDEWLIAAGARKDDPRRGIYATSLVKCVPSSPSELPRMAKRCRRFLDRQLELGSPDLVISLGGLAYGYLATSDVPYASAVCRLFDASSSNRLFSSQYRLLVWPHPSLRNRWHNDPQNRERLRASFALLRPFLE